MSTQTLSELTARMRQLAVASLMINGCLSEMLCQSHAPFKLQDIVDVEQCGTVDRNAWGDGCSLVVLTGRLSDGRRFELRGYLDDDAGLVADASFQFLS